MIPNELAIGDTFTFHGTKFRVTGFKLRVRGETVDPSESRARKFYPEAQEQGGSYRLATFNRKVSVKS